MTEPHLTPDMIKAIQTLAERCDNNPQTVLRRMIYSYAALFSEERQQPDMTNVVPMKEGR